MAREHSNSGPSIMLNTGITYLKDCRLRIHSSTFGLSVLLWVRDSMNINR